MKAAGPLWISAAVLTGIVCAVSTGTNPFGDAKAKDAAAAPSRQFKAEIWADNWFAFYLGDSKIAEDSVPITTVRSFNAETVTFDAHYPLELNFIIKDYVENATGLEYIGTSRQQIGDGGFIMQVTDLSSGKVVAASGSAMQCTAIVQAPLNPECVSSSQPERTCQSRSVPEPPSWRLPGFVPKEWQAATVFSEAEVGPKGGYDEIHWNPKARLIWTSDLKRDNTLLCKLRVEKTDSSQGLAAPAAAVVRTTPAAVTASPDFVLAMPGASATGEMQRESSCDGHGVSPELVWSKPPPGTRAFALVMSTVPRDGQTKWNWLLYDIPKDARHLARGNRSLGVAGHGSDGPGLGYQPPCSKGPGAKRYDFSLYALSANPELGRAPAQVTGDVLLNAVKSLTLGAAKLSVTYTRAP